VAVLAAVFWAAMARPAEAYIGPGAGFGLVASFLAVFAALLLGAVSMLTWPVRLLVRFLRGKAALARSRVRRVVVLGLDGFDPELAERFMAQGKLPHLARLAAEGCFHRLRTTTPALSPVAWSSFQTGVNPGKHNIFDFLSRDKRTYEPSLSSVRIGRPSRVLRIGPYEIPLSKPAMAALRKSAPFWRLLGEAGVPACVLRVPITFPPERFRGLLLSAMCVPDLRGTQGTFTFYTSDPNDRREFTGGQRVTVQVRDRCVEAVLYGPPQILRRRKTRMELPFRITWQSGADHAELRVGGQKVRLSCGRYSDWIQVRFAAGLGIKVRGICRFLLKQLEPHFALYVSPIQIDPERPALPISHPTVFATYLAKRLGPYATLGLAEDTWALNERVLDEQAFLAQCELNHREREQMLFDVLDKLRRGLCVCVIDATDRIQHMFWRYTDPEHPARQVGEDDGRYAHTIERLYQQMDELVGRVLDRLDPRRDVFILISDHGFKPFRRGVDLNAWLARHGYLKLKEDQAEPGNGCTIDYANSRAYALGLAGIYINQRDREAQGIVEPGPQTASLKRELIEKLTGLRDEQRGTVAITKVFDRAAVYHGPYAEEAPDLIIGYNVGYRVCWQGALGRVTDAVFHDNTKAWSADHCMDPSLVPGVFFCNRRIDRDDPSILDIAPSVLDLFGLEPPAYMDGKRLFSQPREPADTANTSDGHAVPPQACQP